MGYFAVLIEENEGGGAGDAVSLHRGGGDKHGSALERLIEFGPCLLDEGLFEGFVGFVAAG